MSDYIPRAWPFPEALPDDRMWKVVDTYDGRACVDPIGVEMIIPTKDTETARNARLHEFGHAAWTPAITPESQATAWNVSIPALQHAEDMRVNTMLRDRCGINMGACCEDSLLYKIRAVAGGAPSANAQSLIARALSSAFSTETYEVALRIFRESPLTFYHLTVVEPVIQEAYEALVRGSTSSNLTWEGTGRAAHVLHRVIRPDDGFDIGEFPILADAREAVKGLTVTPAHWGPMEIEYAPLVERVPRKSKRTRASMKPHDNGDAIIFPERYCTGIPKVFGRRHIVFGGTTLIDGSGSMHWTVEGLHTLIERNPLGTIAIYSGEIDCGAVRVIARAGKRSSQDWWKRPRNGANVVDGPALHWLARQPAPRVWVSDGCVTGVGDSQTPNLVEDSKEIVARANIKQVANLNEAILLFVELER